VPIFRLGQRLITGVKSRSARRVLPELTFDPIVDPDEDHAFRR
jgi:hypothetical protein